MTGHRDREVRAQAEFAAGRIGHEIHVPSHVFAGKVEKRFGRLQDCGRNPGIARARIGGEQCLRIDVAQAQRGHHAGLLSRLN